MECNPFIYSTAFFLNLNTCCIGVEEEAYNIDLTNMNVINFELNRHTFDAPHIMSLCAPPPRANSRGSAATDLSPDPYKDPYKIDPHIGHAHWTLSDDLMLTNGDRLWYFIQKFQSIGEWLPKINNDSMMLLAWSLCGTCILECYKPRYYGANWLLTRT